MSDYNVNDFFQKSLEFQKNLGKSWMDAMTGTPTAPEASTKDATNPFSVMTKAYEDVYSNWQKQFIDNPFMKMQQPWSYNMFNSNNMQFDLFNKMMNSGKTFTDLSTIWQQLFAKGPFESQDAIRKFIDDNKGSYEKLASDFMLPFLPDAMRPLITNALGLIKQYEGAGKDFIRPWMELSKQGTEDIQKLMKGDTSAYGSLYKSLNKTYEDTYGKIFSATGLGPSREQNEEVLTGFDSFFKMLLSLTELMNLVADVSKENMVTVIEAYQNLTANGTEPKSMKEFYDLWVKINEESFIKVFGTPQFSVLFGDFAKKSCEFKIHSDKVLEQMLSWAPIPKNSDMVSLYKTVYELRKSEYKNSEAVKTLQEEVDALKSAVDELRKSTRKGDK